MMSHLLGHRSLATARCTVARLRASPQLQDLWNANEFNLPALADLLVDVGGAVVALGPTLEAIDLNPVIVGQKGVTIVDALVVFTPNPEPG